MLDEVDKFFYIENKCV